MTAFIAADATYAGATGWVYAALWLAIALILLFSGKKYGKFTYVLSVMFLFMAVWFGLDKYLGIPLLSGMYGWIFRGVMLVFLAIIGIYYYRQKKK